MKKILKFQIFLFLTLVFIASAFALDVANTNTPSINLTFNEFAVIKNASFVCCGDTFPIVGATYNSAVWSTVGANYTSPTGTTVAGVAKAYRFTTLNPLANGIYWLYINATDLAENPKIFSD